MPQLHCYVPEIIATKVQQQAQAAGVSVSHYLAELIKREIGIGWPEGYFEDVIGGWQGEPLQRPPQLDLEQREELLA
jgi:hypothetical protein